MSSKKEEERNEKIIRGLMKLPPNRRCINCNSLGPQYVCTNFWTFICITCSGIHREFTHRVKSVSMAKFTSQEVDSLQRGGNQRAREIYLKDWDIQRQRLPSSGIVENVREFIKSVYVDKKYAGGNSADKPPRNLQSLRNQEDDTRRASSYHSYSQSPPYESQYEDRKYGRVLTRRPGSDRGHYEGKLSSFYSPGHDEDRFANEGSVSRVSDYSVSSAGDPFRSDTQSPNFQKDVRVNSPGNRPVKDISIEDAQRRLMLRTQSDAYAMRDAEKISRPHSQRTASASSFGSFDSSSVAQSVNSGHLFDVASEHEQTSGTQLDRMSSMPTVPQSQVTANYARLDFFSSSHVQHSAPLSAPSVDLFQPQATSSTSPIDLFADINRQHSTTTSKEHNQTALNFAENEGWATFDLPQHETTAPNTSKVPPPSMAPSGAPFGHFDQIPSINSSMQWPSVHSSTTTGSFSSLDNQWPAVPQQVQTAAYPTATMTWNAFEDSPNVLPHASEPQVPAYKPPPPNADQRLKPKDSEVPGKDTLQRANQDNNAINGDVITETVFPPSGFPHVGEMPSHALERKSTNPFDFGPDEPTDMFLDMSSLQSALPDPLSQPAFLDDLAQPWFPQTSYVPPTSHGYMAGEMPTPQLPNLTPQGPVASLGGNPFA